MLKRMLKRNAYSGNALVEYGLPLALVVVSSGVILSFVDIKNLLPQFMASASGGSISGGNIKAPSIGSTTGGGLGTGSAAGGNTYIIGASGSFFLSGGNYPETVGGRGNDKGLIYMPSPPTVYVPGQPMPPGASIGYVPSVDQSVNTGQAMSQSQFLAAALVSSKYADSARVQVAAYENPDEVEANGGWAGLSYGNEAREGQIDAAVEGDLSSITEDVKKEAESTKGESDAAIQAWAQGNAMMLLRTMPDDSGGSGTLNPGNYEKFVKAKEKELQAQLKRIWNADKAVEDLTTSVATAQDAASVATEPDDVASATTALSNANAALANAKAELAAAIAAAEGSK